MNCFSKSAFDRPSTIQSHLEYVSRDAKMLCPLREAFRDAVELHKVIAASVAALNLLCCPAAVILAVAFTVVDPVYAVFGGWATSHIRQEVLKRVPPFADGDAPPAVPLPYAAVRIRASMVYRPPRLILRQVAAAVALVDAGNAAGAAPMPKRWAMHDSFVPAFTSAYPVSCSTDPLRFWGNANDCPSPKDGALFHLDHYYLHK